MNLKRSVYNIAGKQLVKISSEGKISGVCAGLADYFGMDVSIVRIIWALAVVFGVGAPILIYIIMAIILPDYDPDSVPYKEYRDDDDERY